MTAGNSVSLLCKMSAPSITVVFPLLVVCWAFPQAGLPLWRSVGTISAWAGSALLVVSLVLMVRQPQLARLFGGLEFSYRWHHRSGLLAYVLLLMHPLALALDAWFEAPYLAWESLVPWAQSWPIWIGWIALLLLMFGLATTFALHLPYRRWRAFHLALGLGVLLGLVHSYVLLGTVDLILLLILVSSLALSWRWIASDLGVVAYPYQVTQVVRQVTGIIEILLTPSATALVLSPGQFLLVAFGDGGTYRGCGDYHPFSVSGINADGSLRLAIKALGPCTQRIQSIEPGVLVRLQGPFGNFLTEAQNKPQLWVAGGIGVTPFIAALRAHPRTQVTTLIYLFCSTAEAAFLHELTLLAQTDPKFELIPVETCKRLADFSSLLPQVEQLGAREVNICGPAPMVNALMPHLQRHGVASDAIHFERFDFR